MRLTCQKQADSIYLINVEIRKISFIFIQKIFFVAKAKRQLQMFFVAKAKRQLQMFFVTKANRQLQMFFVAKATVT
ncbi:hypothetical protein, partial [Lysinibacillus sp. FJAT-14222]|uniref:hypothetical protein n=1 Tax=Lysinibacillus sp. FJAT-14222 TaxID=1932366 RepID=UPI0006C1FED4